MSESKRKRVETETLQKHWSENSDNFAKNIVIAVPFFSKTAGIHLATSLKKDTIKGIFQRVFQNAQLNIVEHLS